jgi:biotin transport system substrate-specific component
VSTKPNQASVATDIALIAVFAALIAACSLFSIGGAVPITLQTFAVILAGLVLGPWRGALAVVLYLLLGFANLPVFAGGSSGTAVLAGPTAGFLLSFPVAALVAGLVARWAARRRDTIIFVWFIAAGVAAGLVTHIAGVLWWSALPGWTLSSVLAFDVIFVPGDIVKLVLAAAVAVAVHKAFPQLLLPAVQTERQRTPVGV